jgi:hypothetical protein
VAAVAADKEQQLAWEARQRPRAGIAALAAGFLLLAGQLWQMLVLNISGDRPRSGFLESLASVAEPGPIGEQPTQRIPFFEYFVDNAFSVVGAAAVGAVALVSMGYAVTFLAAAVRARRKEFPKVAVYIALVGTVVAAIATILVAVGSLMAVSSFIDEGNSTIDASRDLGGNALLSTGQLLTYLGPFVIGAGLLLVSLNAMRAGLLTRLLGILGVVSGVFFVLPQLFPLPIIQTFWLVAVGLMLLGVGRAGLPPAWRTGEAEPWPTAMQAAQQRRETEERKQGISRPEPEPEPTPAPAGRAHASSKKRKRKRRD